MAVNKVVFDGEPIIDLTGDSVTPDKLLEGETAHNAAGEAIVGTYAASGGGGVNIVFSVADDSVTPMVNGNVVAETDVWDIISNHDWAKSLTVGISVANEPFCDMHLENMDSSVAMFATSESIVDSGVPVRFIVVDSAGCVYAEAYPEITRAGEKIIDAASTDGVAYTADAPWVMSLFPGLQITIIPNRVSANTSPTLDINGLGAKNIIMPIDGTSTGMTTNGAKLANWLTANKPVTIMYDGTYWRADIKATSADSLVGTVSIKNGGTDADNAADALKNLGITYGTTDLTAGTSELATGAIYLVYE